MFRRTLPAVLLLVSVAAGESRAHAHGLFAPALTVKQVFKQCLSAKRIYHHFPMVVQGYYRATQSTARTTSTGALFDSNKVPSDAAQPSSYIRFRGLYVVFPPAVKGAPFHGKLHMRVSGTIYCAGTRSLLRAKSVNVLSH